MVNDVNICGTQGLKRSVELLGVPSNWWTGSTQTQLARKATRRDSTHRHNIERLPERETEIETQCLNSETHMKMKNFDFKTKKKKEKETKENNN